MAQAQRNDIDLGDPLALPAGDVARYEAGGHVAELQADLVRRLTGNGMIAPVAMAVTPLERLVRACSAAGGYAALIASYAAVGLVVARWM